MEYSILKSLNRPFLSLQNLGWCLCGFSFDWLLKLFTQLRWSICTSEPLRTSIRVSGALPSISSSFTEDTEKQRKGGRLSPILPHTKKRPNSTVAMTRRASALEAFRHNPTDGSFAPSVYRPRTCTKCPKLRFLSYWAALLSQLQVISRVKLTCLTTV